MVREANHFTASQCASTAMLRLLCQAGPRYEVAVKTSQGVILVIETFLESKD